MLAEAREIKAERTQTSNAGPEVQKADDLASRLLISIGRDLARLLVEGPWDQIGAFLRLKLNHEQARPSEHHCSDVSAGDPTPTKTIDLVRDPVDANRYRPKVIDGDNGGIPAFLDRKTWASAKSG
jgi:hypothetical protein